MYPVFQSKLKYLTCVSCKHAFFFRGSHKLRGKIPYLLECGHPICEVCAKRNASNTCGNCESIFEQNPNEQENLSLNLYLLGVINASQLALVHSAESNIKFQQPELARLKKSPVEDLEYCSECGLKADFRCCQCEVFFCNTCYSKIHGRALQSHQKILVTESTSNICKLLSSQCEIHQNELIQFYCNQCEVSTCTNCLLLFHQGHQIISQSQRNNELKPQLEDTIEKLAKMLQRLEQTDKKLTKSFPSLDLSQDGDQEREKVEARLVQHFTHLHGVLQNIEKRFMIQLQEHQNLIGNNIELMKEQIKEQKRELESGIKVAIAALRESNSTANITAIIAKLQEQVSDMPCHLFWNNFAESKIQLLIDDSVVGTLTDHCNIKLPSVLSYSLLRTKELPDDYEVEPITPEDIAKSVVPVVRTAQPRLYSLSSSSNFSSSMTEQNQNGVSEHVKITHIKNPGCFYTQPLSRSSELIRLKNLLNKEANIAVRPTELELNKMYLVQYARDMKWYRGRIQNVYMSSKIGQQVADVFYIDYGNIENSIPLERIRNMSVQSSLTPVMARLCTLHDIVPKDGGWSVEANEVMLAMIRKNSQLVQHTFEFTNNTYHVDIMKYSTGDGDRPISIRDALIFLEYGCFITNEKLNRTNPESIRKYFDVEVATSNNYGVCVTHIESPDCIYVQKIGDGANHLTKLMSDMTNEYNGMVEGIIYTPQVGMPCAARCDDEIWYRGKITKLLGNRRIEVYFVDFGNKRNYEYNEVRRLYPKYMSVTALAIKVSLKDVASPKNGEWSVETKDFMVANLLNKFLNMFVFSKENDGCYKVILYIPLDDKDVNFNGVLTEEKFAISTGSSSQFTKAPRTMTKRRKKKSNKIKKSTKISSGVEDREDLENNAEETDPFRLQVNILQVVSPDCIYVADVNTDKSIKKMAGELQEFYNSFKSEEPEKWTKDDVCVAYSAKDKCYHRAKVIKNISPKEVTVFFYDTAITEIVTVKDLQSLHPKFSIIPARAFKVKLAGILPCGDTNTWLSLSCEGLCELLNKNQHSKFYISKVAEIENDAISVELWVRETRTEGPLAPTIVEINSINRMLVNRGIALPVRGYQEEKNKVLAVDLRQQLQQNEGNSTATDVEWLVKNQTNTVCPSDVTTDASTIATPTESDKDENDETDDEESPLPPALAAWLPATPIMDNRFCAVSTNVDQNCTIYLHSLKQNAETLSLIDLKLQEKYGKSTPKACDMTWAPNDLCIAQYHVDEKWYRAQVLEILDNDEIKVLFIDYGNVDECKIGTLRKRVIMGHIPIQATKCLVQGLISDTPSGKWTTPELDIIHAIVVDKESDVTILDRKQDHLVISMTLRSSKDMDLLTYLRDELKFNIRDVDDDDELCEENSCGTVFEINSSETTDVIIEEYVVDYVPSTIGTPMVSNLSSISNSKPVNANNEVSYDEVFAVSTNNPALAMEVEEDVEMVDAELKEDIKDRNLEKEMTNKIHEIKITSFSSDELLCEETIDVSSTTLPSENHSDENYYDDLNSSEFIISGCLDTDDDYLNYTEFIIPDSIEIVNIEPIHLETCTTFFAQLDVSSKIPILYSYQEDLKRVSKNMQEEAATQPKLENISLDAPCAVQYKLDKSWYRAIIIKIKPSTDEVQVRYVDYGNTEYQPTNKLHCLKKEWLSVPVMTLKFRLWGIRVNSDKISKELNNQLENILYAGTCTAKIKQRSNEMLAVVLYNDEQCTELLYDSLIENGMLETAEEQ